MRTCFVVRALPVHRLGGLEHHIRDLALGLAERGHDVDILTTRGGSSDAMAQGVERVRVHEIAGTRPGDYSVGFFRRAHGAVRELHEANRYDVIVAVDLAGIFVAPDAFDVPVVPLIHGTLTSEVPLDRRYWAQMSAWEKMGALWRYKARIGLRPYFRRMLRRARWVIVDSEFTRRELVWEASDEVGSGRRDRGIFAKTIVIPLGIDFERYPAAGERRERGVDGARDRWPLRICLLGRLQRIKGIEIAIRAAEQLRLRGVDFEMSVGGTGDYEAAAREMIAQRELGGCVRLVGRVAPEELGGFFAAHDVFLFPDLTQPAFGLVAVEAMAYGLPVVGVRSGAIPEVVTPEVGWLYDAWDVGGLARLLWEIDANRAEIAVKGKAALERSRWFHSARMAEDMEGALRVVVGEGE